jgi:putative multicomponent Na+:H+ antiporter subunit B
MTESYLYLIVALLPLAAGMVVFQDSPYHALVMRGILGAIATMVYAVLGAADVALTEALVGTTLAITLYAIAVRSSLVMRLGVLEQKDRAEEVALADLMTELRRVLQQRHLRLELVPFTNAKALHRALSDREVHATCESRSPLDCHPEQHLPYQILIRVQRLYDIFKDELPEAGILNYMDVGANTPMLSNPLDDQPPDLEESHL